MDIREFVDVYSKHIYFEMNEEFENLVTMLEIETVMTGMKVELARLGNSNFLIFSRDLIIKDNFNCVLYFNVETKNLFHYIDDINASVGDHATINFSNLREAFEFLREKIKTL